ncbi:ArsA-related P-loop ATPase [Trujillonella endophytica]|uniref:Arsenite-transporting ATPase n=1 Tax=Trujillonella endophytica TaxID=673521 RepID=A0A1H8VN45_9ACTN|nr:ArsA-related P-loop ATPase [Trujillella endophytica]SEP16826.1 arsenite-transporting ATPase [Trujillella endophytica]
MATLLVTGPGGAGSSTVSAAVAVRAARSGSSAVLISRRPPPVEELGDVAGLRVVTVDPQRAFEELWGPVGPAVAAALPDLPVPPGSSVVAPPGAADLALLAELARTEADVVVVDAGPLDAALALLALPGALRWWLGQVLPTRLRVLGAVRTAAVRTGTVRPGPVDAVLSAVPVVERLLSRVSLGDPATTGVRLVVEPRRSAVAAVRESLPVLALHGQRVAGVSARVLPDGGAGEWWASRLAEQAEVLAELAQLAPVTTVPERASAPASADDLAGLLDDDGATPAAAPVEPAPVRVPGGWQLVVPLPYARRGALELTRWDDDLVVTVAGSRRSLRLDALLRRCVVTGGSLADAGSATARLVVDFAPDPQQWPADLLAAEGSTA